MIATFPPPEALQDIAPGLTGLIYAGADAAPIDVAHVALDTDGGEVIPFCAVQSAAYGGLSQSAAEIAGLLRCAPTPSTLRIVLTETLSSITQRVAATVAPSTQPTPTSQKPTPHPLSGSFETLLAEMEAVEAAHTKSPKYESLNTAP